MKLNNRFSAASRTIRNPHATTSRDIAVDNVAHASSTGTSTGRRPRVLFDAFNLEATSDDVKEEQRIEYNADKKPSKVKPVLFWFQTYASEEHALPGHSKTFTVASSSREWWRGFARFARLRQ